MGRMRILFIHQNTPGQFRHLIGALCADPANSVWAIVGAEPPNGPGTWKRTLPSVASA